MEAHIEKTNRYRCNDCNHVFTDDEVLVGKNPFQEEYTIYGCPNCKEVEDFIPLCQWGECSNHASAGIPYEDDYYHVCGDHYFRLASGNKNDGRK